MSRYNLNPSFNPVTFFQEYWQQRPCVLPQLVPGFADPVSPEELAGLACEEWVESRLVTETEKGRWQLQHGPFQESVFAALGSSHWTLLVQAVDQWVEEVANLRALFEFIPRWRIDDVMVSYAVDQGGVGPHFDYYDVFLLQGSGQRIWQVGTRVAADTELDNQDGVGILRTFQAEQEFILNPGDALYVPPGYGHWGRSRGASCCYSIGFRAPALSEMLEGFSDTLIAQCQPFERFTDNPGQPPADPACIDPRTLAEAYQQLQLALDNPGQFAHWFGRYVTRPKYPELVTPREQALTTAELGRALAAGSRLGHNPGSRLAFLPAGADADLVLFVDGEAYVFPSSYADVISEICDATLLNKKDFSRYAKSDPLLKMLRQLVNQGSLLLH